MHTDARQNKIPDLRLETARLILRPMRQEDAPALAVAMRDANVTDTTMIEDPPRPRAEAERRAAARIDEFTAHWLTFGYGIFGLFDKSNGGLTGYCGLRHIDEYGGDLNVSTMVDRPYWSSGFAHEVLWRVYEFGFIDIGFDVIYGGARQDQTTSIHLMQKFGFDRLDDRSYRHWTMAYFALRRDIFLPRYVAHLKGCAKLPVDAMDGRYSGLPRPTLPLRPSTGPDHAGLTG
jgi:ribosomal-protein-alanine N-acetyltransferase